MSRIVSVRRPSHSRPRSSEGSRGGHLRVAALSALAGLLAAGCSADITRFDGKGYGLTDSNSATIPPQGMRRGEATKLGELYTETARDAYKPFEGLVAKTK